MKKCDLSYSKKSVIEWYRMDKQRVCKGYSVEREDRKKTTKTNKEITRCST